MDALGGVCGRRLRVEGDGLQLGTLQAHCASGIPQDGERYEAHLRECCFFATASRLCREGQVKRSCQWDSISCQSAVSLNKRLVCWPRAGRHITRSRQWRIRGIRLMPSRWGEAKTVSVRFDAEVVLEQPFDHIDRFPDTRWDEVLEHDVVVRHLPEATAPSLR